VFSLAGFQVTTIGRIWVTAEVRTGFFGNQYEKTSEGNKR